MIKKWHLYLEYENVFLQTHFHFRLLQLFRRDFIWKFNLKFTFMWQKSQAGTENENAFQIIAF